MHRIIEETLDGLKIGAEKNHGGMSVRPIIQIGSPILEYEMLSEATSNEWLRVTEISDEGSVPELKLVNESDKDILILDGEELHGAKQNRVLNTSILVGAKARIVVPVSCTEQGRWNRVSETFGDSEKMLFGKARRRKMESVHRSLERGSGHRSDQHAVWDEIGDIQMKLCAHSNTGAMKDVFDQKKVETDEYLDIFDLQEGQCGIVVALGGKIMGFEYVSRPDCYSRVHRRLIESYALDAIADQDNEFSISTRAVEEFMEAIWHSRLECFPSVSKGEDLRLESDSFLGASLIHQNEIVHMTVFMKEESPLRDTNRIRSFLSRRRNRIRNQ